MINYPGITKRESKDESSYIYIVDGYSTRKTLKAAIKDFGKYVAAHVDKTEGEAMIQYQEEYLCKNCFDGNFYFEAEEVGCASNWNEEADEMEYKDGYWYLCALLVVSKEEEAAAEAMRMEEETKTALANALCTNHRGKMRDMISLSTSVLENKECQRRRAEALKAKEAAEAAGFPFRDIICLHCFAEAQFEYQKTCADKYARNTELLTRAVYPVDWFPIINASIGRLEAFGDIQAIEEGGINQGLNYIHYCKRNPDTTFACWTKNPAIWKEVYAIEKKPDNLIMIYSDPVVNGTMEDPAAFLAILQIVFPFLDKIFVVYDKEAAKKQDINCGARYCNGCRNCYRFNGPSVIREIQK